MPWTLRVLVAVVMTGLAGAAGFWAGAGWLAAALAVVPWLGWSAAVTAVLNRQRHGEG